MVRDSLMPRSPTLKRKHLPQRRRINRASNALLPLPHALAPCLLDKPPARAICSSAHGLSLCSVGSDAGPSRTAVTTGSNYRPSHCAPPTKVQTRLVHLLSAVAPHPPKNKSLTQGWCPGLDSQRTARHRHMPSPEASWSSLYKLCAKL